MLISRQQKVDWLLANPDVWERYPNPDRGGIGGHDRVIFEAMQKAGLFSEKTRWQTVDLVQLIGRARAERRRRFKLEATTEKPKRAGRRIELECKDDREFRVSLPDGVAAVEEEVES
jgi:hypothetical protein